MRQAHGGLCTHWMTGFRFNNFPVTDDIDDDAEAKDRITSITVMACCSTNCWQVKMEKSHIAPQNHLLFLGLKLQKE